MSASLTDTVDRKEMRRMWLDGKTLQEIGDRFGMTRQAASYHVRKFGIKGGCRKRTEERNEKIVRLFKEGRSWAEIAVAMNLSPSTINKCVHQAGLLWRQR